MKKKILYVHHAGGMGGAPRSVAFLIKELDFTKYEPIIWMMRDGDAKSLFESTGAKVIVNNNKFIQSFHGTTVSGMSMSIFLRNLIGYFPTYFLAKKIIKEISPDIVHLSTTCLFHFAKAVKFVNDKIKVISHIREPLLPNFFGRILLKQNINNVDSFVAISNNDGEVFIKKGAKVSVIHNFVNLDDYIFNDKIRKVYRNELEVKDTLVISFFARVSPSNGVLDLLKIAKKLNSKRKIKFFVFGFTGATDYEKKVEKNKPANVQLMPMTNKVKEYLMASDLLISPFTKPHFARSIVEASALGIPSIASNVKSQNELIKDKETGFLYSTIDEAVNLINKLYDDKVLLEVMGANARIFAENKFSASKNAKETFKTYV